MISHSSYEITKVPLFTLILLKKVRIAKFRKRLLSVRAMTDHDDRASFESSDVRALMHEYFLSHVEAMCGWRWGNFLQRVTSGKNLKMENRSRAESFGLWEFLRYLFHRQQTKCLIEME
jgi:hypothetical protein